MPSPAAGAVTLGYLLAMPTSPGFGQVSSEIQAMHPGCFSLVELLWEEICEARAGLVIQEPTGDTHAIGKVLDK